MLYLLVLKAFWLGFIRTVYLKITTRHLIVILDNNLIPLCMETTARLLSCHSVPLSCWSRWICQLVNGKLPQTDTETILQAFISSHLDYCKSLFTCLNQKPINQLQIVENSAARHLTRNQNPGLCLFQPPCISSWYALELIFRSYY